MDSQTPAQEPTAAERRAATRTGLLYGLAAFGTWGLVAPVHFKLLTAVPGLEILAQRIVWSTIFVLTLIGASRRWPALARALAPGRNLGLLCVSAALVAVNWLVYIWAINGGHVVQASLGYFMNPLVNVVLGVVFLGERLSRLQIAACALAATGVLILTVSGGALPWISLVLAISFGFYGLVRKTVRVDPLIGFCVESLLLLPPSVAYILFQVLTGTSAFLTFGWWIDLLLILTGITTAAPLIWFAVAAQRLKLSTVGLLQYLAPSCILALGVLLYGEPFTPAHALAFGAIWAALALYSVEALGIGRRARA